ncbi:MAG: type III toxin-antitoxin system ToxN/AbiQ family toxin [Ruminococcus sp.]|nr:type III toxin-antitoxin system ToxN/AbiQ family toxin [Ruminococcus sp.]
METIKAVSPTVSGIYLIKKAADKTVAFFYEGGYILTQKRLSFYQIDIKYVRDLAQKDDAVRSVSPQILKERRPFVGIIIILDDKKYCVPLSSPKPKHEKMKNDRDFTRIVVDGKIIGVLNFNSMIPVDDRVIKCLDLHITSKDTMENRHYKTMCIKQLNWCQKNQNSIVTKANKLYRLVTETPEKNRNLTHRCCDFQKLETILARYLSKQQLCS